MTTKQRHLMLVLEDKQTIKECTFNVLDEILKKIETCKNITHLERAS